MINKKLLAQNRESDFDFFYGLMYGIAAGMSFLGGFLLNSVFLIGGTLGITVAVVVLAISVIAERKRISNDE